jgi:hypothetical protein
MDKTRKWPNFAGIIQSADEIAGLEARGEAELRSMFKALNDKCTICEIARAVVVHIQTSPLAIETEDIIGYLRDIAELKSATAWRTFVYAVNRYGHCTSVVFPYPAYHYAIIRMGGWEKIAREFEESMTDGHCQFLEEKWRELYEWGLRGASWEYSHEKVDVPRHLCGFWERDRRERRLYGAIQRAVVVASGKRVDQQDPVELERVTTIDPEGNGIIFRPPIFADSAVECGNA